VASELAIKRSVSRHNSGAHRGDDGIRSPSDRPRRGPGSRADADHPTRKQLLDAALVLLDNDGWGELPISEITRHAGVAKGTFYVHFADRDAFVVALHQRFHDELFGEVAAASADLPPGRERLEARFVSFLDGCRQMSGVRSLLWNAGRQPALRTEVLRRDSEAAAAIAEDLAAIGRAPLAAERARLLVAAVTAVTVAELEANQILPGMRAALQILALNCDRH